MDNIEMDLKKLGYNELEGIHVAQDGQNIVFL